MKKILIVTVLFFFFSKVFSQIKMDSLEFEFRAIDGSKTSVFLKPVKRRLWVAKYENGQVAIIAETKNRTLTHLFSRRPLYHGLLITLNQKGEIDEIELYRNGKWKSRIYDKANNM